MIWKYINPTSVSISRSTARSAPTPKPAPNGQKTARSACVRINWDYNQLHPFTHPVMAEGGEDPLLTSLQKLDAELTCPVCTDHFKEPKVLPCLHYYCKTCIGDLIKRAKGHPFNCPECRREVGAANTDADGYDE